MNCKKKPKAIGWREVPNIVFIRNRSMHIERGRTQELRRAKQFPFHYFPRRVTIVTNLMSSYIAPFLITDLNMVSAVIIILTFVVAVYSHKCKDFKLSASDQSVIDMMKHYLHTSRKTQCSDNKLSNTLK